MTKLNTLDHALTALERTRTEISRREAALRRKLAANLADDSTERPDSPGNSRGKPNGISRPRCDSRT